MNLPMNLTSFVLTFLVGTVAGFFLRGFFDKKQFVMTEQASKNFLLIVVAVIWAYAMLIDLSNPNYDVPLAVHGILGMIVGFFFYRPGNGGEK